MPPYRAWAGLRFEKGRWHTEAQVKHVGEQNRVYGFETPTEGYTLVSAHGSYSLAVGRATHTLSLRLDNLLDETYRNHLNYIKDLTPEMGFSARLVYALRF
jgi:iron complex outermembrane receptor protein